MHGLADIMRMLVVLHKLGLILNFTYLSQISGHSTFKACHRPLIRLSHFNVIVISR